MVPHIDFLYTFSFLNRLHFRQTRHQLKPPDFTGLFAHFLNNFLTLSRNLLARYLVIYAASKLGQDMKLRNVLLVIFTVGLALIPFIKNSINKQDEFDASQDLFI